MREDQNLWATGIVLVNSDIAFLRERGDVQVQHMPDIDGQSIPSTVFVVNQQGLR